MAISNNYKKYQEQAVYTMSPGERIIMLYDKAIFNMNIAMMHIDSKKPCEAHNFIIKTEDIVLYLRGILDMRYPVSKVLFDSYTYMHKMLVMANIKKDKEILTQLIDMMTNIKSAWEQLEASSHENAMSQVNCV